MSLYRSPVRRVEQTTDKHLLIVDDMAQMRDMIRVMLRKNGYQVVTAVDSGNRALRELALHPTDLVIADWLMPNMSGIELLKEIKGNPEFFLTPVLMVTGENDDAKVRYAVEEGVDGFLMKPFSEIDLIRNIKLALGKKTALKSESEKRIIEMKRLMLSKDYREALEVGYEIFKVSNNQRVALMICDCLYKLNDCDKAMSMIVDVDTENQTSRYSNLLGKIHLDLGQCDQAISALENAVRMNHLNSDLKIDLAGAYFAVGRCEEAEQAIQGIITSNPTDLNKVNIAQIYLDQNNLDKAGHLLDQTVEPIQSTVNVFNNYAVALRQVERLEDAANIYLKCLKIDPESDVLHYNLAVLYIKSNRISEAHEVLTKALKLNPDNKLAKELLLKCQ